MQFETELVHYDAAPGDPTRPDVTPIHQTATFAQESALEFGRYDYTRSGNPTRDVLEQRLAVLEGGAHAFAFTSGMAALSALLRTLRPGERVLAGRELYGGTVRLLEHVLPAAGIAVDRVDVSQLELVRAALSDATRLVLIETPTNPRLEIADIAALAELAHARGALLAVDNSLLSPYLQRPLALGADVVVHSATKHLAGHGDVMAGALVCKDPQSAERIAFAQNAEGAGLAPFDGWLVLRGIKTLAVRLDRAQENARALAALLVGHPAVRRVHWPGLADHPGFALHARQARGPGSVLSFETGDAERSRRIVEGTRLFRIAVSFGSTSSRISLPVHMSHASVERGGPPADLVRLVVGLEGAADLVEDLGRALDESAARPVANFPAIACPHPSRAGILGPA